MCSTSDAKIFRELNEDKIPVTIVPNGIDICRNTYQFPDISKPKQLIFCGSLDYEPNIEGLIWFLKSVWPLILSSHPDLKLIVVGKGKPSLALLKLLENDTSIDLVGEVTDVIPYYRQAQVAIVPLLHGSGTRLKILEAMSLGVPVISTSVGAEGIDYSKGESVVIADTLKQFSEAVDQLFKEPLLFTGISERARKLVEKEYSWDVIGKEIMQKILPVIPQKSTNKY